MIIGSILSYREAVNRRSKEIYRDSSWRNMVLKIFQKIYILLPPLLWVIFTKEFLWGWRYIREDSKNCFLFIHNKWKIFIGNNVKRSTKVLENRISDNVKKEVLKKKLDHMRDSKRRKTTKQQNLIKMFFFSF